MGWVGVRVVVMARPGRPMKGEAICGICASITLAKASGLEVS